MKHNVSLYDYCINNIEYKNVLDEWDYKLNKDYDVKKITYGSKKKYYFKCNNNHSYLMRLDSKTGKKKSGCPICSNKVLLVGYNDLKSVDKYLALEFDNSIDLNNNINSEMVFGNSNIVYKWKCVWCNNIYSSSIKNRRGTRYSGCNKCGIYQSSYSEFILKYYLELFFKDVLHRYFYKGIYNKLKEEMEFDLFVCGINLGIECDGYYAHKQEKKYMHDLRKDSYAIENNINLFRFRDENLINLRHSRIYSYANKYDITFDNVLISLIRDAIMYAIHYDYAGLKEEVILKLKENGNRVNLLVNNNIIDVRRDFYMIEHLNRKMI